MSGALAPAVGRSAIGRRGWTEAGVVTLVLAGLLIWLPLQTPVALLLYQYGGVPVGAVRALLLAKDVIAAGLIVILLLRHWRRLAWHWFDLAAIGYVAAVALYTAVPILLGAELVLSAAVASIRQLVLPMELYALGRLAAAAGVRPKPLLVVYLGISALAAVFLLLTNRLLPITFWTSTLDMVSFVREVQGIRGAQDVWDISLVGSYGLAPDQVVPRAIGPFTHPVGASHYFVPPLLLATAGWLHAYGQGRWRSVVTWSVLVLLFIGAVLAPMSRASWVASGIGVLLLAIGMRRLRIGLAGLAVVGAFLVLVPPYSYAVRSALDMTDSSAVMHVDFVEDGIEEVGDNPLGQGVGRGDYIFGETFAGGAQADTSQTIENLYLSILIALGPLGLAAFLAWVVGLALNLLPRRGAFASHWILSAMLVALIGLAVASMTSSAFMRFTTAASFWLLVGVLVRPSIVRDGRRWLFAARRS